ncbi:MAG: doubled motif LPXTG anchor domain-containing protein [Hungatella sp.]|uniref:doubled motif LPXTG anchor domain-containing protein n=1 Tax=Hungatella sp. TaxID=2613924 RepID=UPI003992108F
MKGLRKKFRRGLAAFLAFVLTMTSVNTVSLADVSNALETEKATFVMSGEDIVESAQAAIDNGSTFTYEDLGIEETGSTAKEYQKLFTNGTVYEIAPSYDLDEEENADGANLRMFIRVKGETEGYQITGEEEIIFLYINDSESKIAFRSRIDDYVTDKVTVKGNSSLAETEKPVLDENGNAIEGDKPAQTPEESTVPSGETGSVEETKEPETEAPAQVPEESMQEPESEVPTQEPETTAPAEEPKTEAPTQAETEKPTQAPVQEPETQAPVQEPETQAPETDAATQAPEVQEPDTEAPAPEPEAPAQEPEAADTGNETVSIIRNNTYVLTTAIEPTSEESDVSIVDEEVPKADSPKEDTEANTPADNPVSVSTGSNADKGDHADHEENKPSEKIEGKTYGHVLLNEESYAKAYVTTLDKMGISVEVAEGLTLTIHHNAFYNDKDISEDEVIRGLKEGDVINPADYAWDKESLTYLGSMPEQITISAEAENKVELFYDEIPVEREEEDVQILNAVPRNYYRSRLADDNTTPGKVFPTKTAEWVDEVNGLAKINFTIYGNPVRQGSDVILIVDSSGSMSGTKWSTAKSGAKGFVDNLYESVDGVPSDNRIAIVDFDSSAIAYPGINNSTETFLKADETIKVGKKKPVTYSATDYFKTYVIDNQMSASGGTNYDYAFQAAKKIIDGRTDTSRPVYIVFMSDGEPRDYDWSDYHTGQKDAADLREQGVTIYSIGLNIGDKKFNNFIVPLASSPKSTYAINIEKTSDLVGIYDAIASSIKIAGTEATITDVINTEAFEIATDYNNGMWYEASTGTVNRSSDNKTVTWDFGNISANKETLTIYIKVKDSVPGGTAPDTNKEAKVDYTDPNEQSQTQDIPSPNLAVGDVGTITLNYYLVNEDGITINGTGEAIDFERRQQLGTKLYGDAPQEFGSYTVNAPSTIEYNGIKYQYVAASASKDGSANPANVELSPAKKAVNLYYGYQEIKDVTVTFHGNGGTPSVSSVTVPKDTALGGQIATAAREDHNFLGWNTAMDGSGSAFTSNTIVTDNITVYAQWQKKQALTIKAADTEKVYNGEMQYASETGYESTGLKAGHRITNIKASGSGRDVQEDGYPITITGSVKVVNESGVDVTHEYTITKEPGTLTIKPKEVTITVDNSSKAYGSLDPKFTGKVEGLVNETDLGTVSFVRTNEAEEVDVYKEVLAAEYKANKNYTVSEHRGDFEIKVATMPGASLSAKGGSWEYDGNAHYAAATLNKADGYTVYYKVNDGDWTVNPPSVTEVSEGIVTVSVKATKHGYVDLETENVTLQITPKPATITVKNAEKTFGESDPTFEGTVQGLVNSTDLGTVTYKRSNDTESVGTYNKVLIPEYKENTNYKITVKPGDFKINPAKDPEADLKIAGGSWPYDGKEHKVKLNVIDSALAALKRYTIEYSTDGGQTWSKNVPGVTNVSDGTLTVIARGTREGYEPLKSNEAAISITPAPVTIVVDNAEKFYDEKDPAFTGKINGLVKAGDLGNVIYSRTNNDEEVGVYQDVLTANYTSNENYTVEIEKGNFEIKSASLEGAVLTAVGGEWTYDGNAHAATAALENAPGYTIYYKTGNGEWTTEAPSVTNVADGLVTVSVKAERHGYEALEAEDVTLKILPKEVIIQVKNAEKFFDEPDPKFEGTVSALVNQEDLGTVTYTRENTEEAVGIYNEVLTANYTSNGNYEVTIKKGDFEIKTATLEGASLSAAGGSWTYDGKTHYANAELTNADNYTIYYRVGDGEWTTDIPGVTNVSEGELTVSVKATRTGYVDLVTEDVKLVITPRDATITVNDAEKFYDENDPSFTGTETNLVKAGDLGTVTYRRTNDDEEVGTYEEVLTADYTANDNYKVTVVNADFTIKTASIAGAKLTAAGGSWIYDGEAHAAAGRVENADGYTVYYKVGDGEWTTEAPSVTNVLDGTVTVSVKATRTGYEELTTDAVALEIIPKDAAIVVDDAEKFYDEADPKFTGTVTGLVKEGDLTGLTYIRTNNDEAVGIYPEVLAAAYIKNENYNVTEHKGTFEIKTATMKDAKMTADGGSWVYDGAAHAATASLKNADGYTVYYKAGDGEWTTTAPSVTNVAEGIVTVSVKATKTGYTDLTAEDVTIQITKKPATITVNNAEKFFNEADPVFTGTVTKLVADSDLGTITYVRTNDAAGVGTYENVLDAVYTDNTNYEVTVKRGDFKIKEATDPEADLKIVGGSWVYDGDEHRVKLDVIDSVLAALKKYKIEYSTDGGNTWSETVPGVTNVADGTVTVIARGTREGYETLVSNETTIQITARTATIRVHDAEKFFDESDPAFTGTEENLVKAGDLGTVTYRRTNADEAVGTYPEVLTADYTANSNYIVNVVNGDFEIKTASIKDAKLEATGGSWIYDGAAHAASGNVTNADGYTVYYKAGNGEWTTEAPSVTNVLEGTVTVSVKAVRSGYADLTTEDVTLKITPREAVITVDHAEKYFDEQDPEFTGTAANLVASGDLGTITYRRTNTEEAVGTYPKVLTADYESNSNYIVTVVKGDFAIKTAFLEDAVLTAAGGSWNYDGAAHEAAAKLEHAPGYTIYYKAGNGEWSTEAPSVTNVADGTVTVSVKATKTGYEDLTAEDVTIRITARPATIVVDNKSKSYSDIDPLFTGQIQGLISDGDLGTVVYHRLDADKNKEAVGADITLTASYSDNSNYKVEVKNGKLDIIALNTNTVNVTGETVTYDGKTHGLREVTALKEGSTILYSVDNQNFSETVPVFTEAGSHTVYVKAVNPNYHDTAVVTGIVVIQKRALSITAASAERKYNGTELTAPTASITDGTLADGQTLTAVKVTGSQTSVGSSENIASDAVIMADNGEVTSNYNITYLAGTLRVTSGSSGGGGGGGGNTPNPDKPYVPEGPGTDPGTVTIEPGEVPLANLPESSSADNLVLIDDGNVPLAGLPKTGDRAGAHAGLAALLSGFLLAAFTALSSKKREEEK